MPSDPNPLQGPEGGEPNPKLGAGSRTSFLAKVAAHVGAPVNWVFLLIIIIFAVIFYAFVSGAQIIARLSDPGFARGLITFIICVATIGLAFILVFQAMSTQHVPDENFRRGREVFTGLMGVLGTIVGFYFGSAEKGESSLEVAPIKISQRQLFTHVAGGIKPYVYVITTSDKGFPEIKKVSEDGWINETLPQEPTAGS